MRIPNGRNLALLAGATLIVGALTSDVAWADDAPAGAPDAVATQALWTKNCAGCHGADAKGQTKMGQMLKIRDFTDPAVHATLKREQMIAATKDGVKKEGTDKLAMKGFADKLSETEIAALVDHILGLGE
jgi:cytochrome c553